MTSENGQSGSQTHKGEETHEVTMDSAVRSLGRGTGRL